MRERIGVVYDGDNFPAHWTAKQLSQVMEGYAILICEELAAQYKNKRNRDTISRQFS